MAELQELARLAAKYVNTTQKHVFLTGKAGTGKTTFLRYIKDHTFKNTIVAAPTGIAAINAGGVTLHSLLHLPFGIFIPASVPINDSHERISTPQTLFRERKFNAAKRRLIREMELLIIDEVSMLRADLLDCIDFTLRFLRNRRGVPFGGVQILFIGDLLQLPPVIKDQEAKLLNNYYASPYFYDALALKDNPPIRVELDKIFRQKDSVFIEVLNRLRQNTQTSEDLELLNTHYDPNIRSKDTDGHIYLTTHNKKADDINNARLEMLTGTAYTYHARIEGDFPEHMYPINASITLKKGAQVMFVKNDPTGQGQYFNGKIGYVSELNDDCIYVTLEDESIIEVPIHHWENNRYSLNKETGEIETKTLGQFSHFPIRLAWAVTIHKSQGLTFEKAILDLSDTFAPGQLYVALSRLTSLQGLTLASRLPISPPALDASLTAYLQDFQDSDLLKSELNTHRKDYLLSFTDEAFNLSEISKRLYYHEKSFNKDERRSIKQQFQSWTSELVKETRNLQDIGEKFIAQVRNIATAKDYLHPLADRLTKAQPYFENQIESILEKIKAHRLEIKKEKQVKAYVKELEELEAAFINQLRKINKVSKLIEYAAQNKVLTKKDLQQSGTYHVSKPKYEKPNKPAKTPTAQISYDLYKSGKTISEIARERGLVIGTIAGHLVKFVATGEIPIADLLDQEKLDKIIEACNSEPKRPGEIKSQLGDSVSYGDINLALAHLEWLAGKQ